MSFHFLVTCVSQKKAKKTQSILDEIIQPGSTEYVFKQWNQVIRNSNLKPRKAIDLYKGSLWGAYLDVWGLIKNKEQKAHLWILSAGFGLINAEEDAIVPYDITFQENRNGIPSLHAKITDKDESLSRKEISQKWWDLLIKFNNNEPSSIESLVKTASEQDFFLIVVGKDYLEAVFNDLQAAIKISKNPKRIIVISNNPNDPTANRIKSNWLYADSRLIGLQGTNSTLVNAKIAKEILWHMYSKENGCSWWDKNNFDNYLEKLSSTIKKKDRPNREISADSQVKDFIRESIKKKDIPFSKLHRTYRDNGKACEYQRFKKLYLEVKNELKNQITSKRSVFPVRYIKRKAKMLFFLPDWDDRVDPLFDFEKDECIPNRNPYLHDAYHYELYGHLNCDGILVSKTVLEENVQKKEKVNKVGIHKYLRLPLNVPVLGDCGAFNYITQENPPFETGEILNYYEALGFNYGVSIDHLIIPGILKRDRHLKLENNEWIDISSDEFETLKRQQNSSTIKNRNLYKQNHLFNSGVLICKESYIDENEKLRRYLLTIENARKFIKGHRQNKYSFTPIGAVQGWDPESYANAVKEYQEMGYEYIALGGLVKSKTTAIIEVLEKIATVKKPKTKLHLFGIARLDAIADFLRLGINSVDSAGMLRQAWLSSKSNYYSPDRCHFTAIRVPPADKGKASQEALKKGNLSKDELTQIEKDCLDGLRNLDKNLADLYDVLDIVMKYNKIFSGQNNLYDNYVRTLTEKPWKNCPCKLCKEIGIDIIIFRRNNRNRRRGFHNTWVFFKQFRSLTDIK